MTKKPIQTNHELRQRAERLIDVSANGAGITSSPFAVKKILRELLLHQTELEMQNEELRNVKQRLDASQARYFDIYDLATVGYLTLDEGRLIKQCNLFAAGMIGINRNTLVTSPISKILFKKDQVIFYKNLKRCLELDVPQHFEMRFVRADGSAFWVLLQMVTMKAGEYWLTITDISRNKQVEAALRKSEVQLSAYLQNTPLAAVSWDANFHCTQWNKVAEKMFGYSADEALGKHAIALVIPETESEVITNVFTLLMTQKGGSRHTSDNKTKDGSRIICDWYNTVKLNDDGKAIGVVSLVDDITPRKQAEALIWKQANYDALTGLANREMLNKRLQQEIENAVREAHSIALLYLGLDQFKDVNDTLGHHTGDVLLIEVAKRLSHCIGDADILARVGGDEFTIIMTAYDSSESVERLANNLLQKLAAPFSLGNQSAYISTSIGITLYPSDATDGPQMFKNASQAMYAAKKLGRNCFQYFTTSMQEDALSRVALINDLRTALPNQEFQLYYQAIVNLVDGNIHKAEALIHWQHPTRGLVSSVAFIPVAEETGMIIDIGDWVFRQAVQQSALWRTVLHPDFQISVNTSPAQYLNVDFSVTSWLDHLQSLGVSGEAVAVEITEGLLMNIDKRITDMLLVFRDAGIQVSLDDFGTGHSSMFYLQKLDIDYVKIDQLFVRNLEADSDDLALCEAIIVMAHKLGLKVIAEGIESKLQRDLLTAVGCDFGQGYLFSKPLPAKEFENMFILNKRDAKPRKY
jgi:diguanylate cyclase (GGDEF)-like protein/PAS domain S-box-containing protein